MANQMNMTEGRLFGKILRFTLPLILTNVLQVFYNVADMIIVSLSSEPDAVGAIGTSAVMLNLFINLFIGFSIGANVVTARHIGANERDKVSRVVHTTVLASLMFGLGIGVLGIVFGKPILALMGNWGKLLELASQYVMIYFIGTPFLSLTNFTSAILRAEGNTKTPLIVLSCTGFLNVILNLFFVLALDMSADGVALATMISNVASAMILLFYLSRSKGPCRFSLKKLVLDRWAFKSIVNIGLPAAIQGILFSLSNIIIQSSIIKVNNIISPAGLDYQPVVKANSAVANAEGFAYAATNSVAQASTTFIGQNYGAKKYKRIGAVMRNCYLITFFIAAIFAGLLILLRNPILSLYGIVPGADGTGEAIAYSAAATKIFIMFPTYFLLAFMEVGSGIMRGLGRSLTSTIVSLVGSCLLRIVWICTVFAAYPTLEVVYISYPITWGLTALIHFICCNFVRRKLLREEQSVYV